jgi:hypothetical protein
MVGLALIINGVIVNKLFSVKDRVSDTRNVNELDSKPAAEFLPPADTNELFPAGFSVTDETTKHLDHAIRRKS